MPFDFSRFADCRILVIGDLMIDVYQWGEVDRISPEAPVPIVSINRESFTLGGSGNVVNNLTSLGAKVHVAGVAGTGRWSKLLISRMGELGISAEGIVCIPDRPTTRKTRIIAANQQVLRIDRETTDPIHERYLKPVYSYIQKIIPEVDAVLVSDYGKGIITDDLMETMTTAALKNGKIIIADPKGMDYTRYTGVTLLTPNKKEAGLAAGIDIKCDATLLKAGRRLLDIVRPENLLITCGKDGMVLMNTAGHVKAIPARSRQVFDVSGAGDTVLALMGLASAAGLTFEEGAHLANLAAGIVVGKLGTATVSVEELSAAVKSEPV